MKPPRRNILETFPTHKSASKSQPTCAVGRFVRVVAAVVVAVAVSVEADASVVTTGVLADAARRHGLDRRQQHQCRSR